MHNADPTSEFPLLLIHGWGASSASWDAFETLWPPGRKVIAPDLPGHGGEGSGPFTVGHAVELIAARLADSGPVVAIGHSMGGQITTLLHARHPELVAAEIVIDPAYGMPDADAPSAKEWADSIRRDGSDSLAQFVDSGFSALTGDALRRSIQRSVAATPPDVLADYLESEYVTPGAIGCVTAAQKVISERTKPTLGMYSNEPAAAFERAAGPATVTVWPDHGHYLHQETPIAFAAHVVDWIHRL